MGSRHPPCLPAPDPCQVFHANGAHFRTIGGPGTDPGQFDSPIGVDVDGDGNIVVADHGNHRVQVLSSDGRHLRTWGGPDSGSAVGHFSSPLGVAVDVDGCIIVADQSNNRLQLL